MLCYQIMDEGCSSNLLEKQKKEMREIGNVNIPQSAFLSALKMGDE